MILESALNTQQKYEYRSPSLGKRVAVKFDGKRNGYFVFRRVDTLDEIWVKNFDNIYERKE